MRNVFHKRAIRRHKAYYQHVYSCVPLNHIESKTVYRIEPNDISIF
jgi:hypothetical protein